MQMCHTMDHVAMVIKRTANRIRATPAMSDSELLARARKGDTDAFGKIVRRYQGFVYRQAWGYLRDNDAAKDAAQDVFISAYEGIRYLRTDPALCRWLFRICKNRCLNVIRRRKTERDLRPDPPAAEASNVPLRVRLMGFISRLNDPYRDVVLLRYYNNLTYNEMAEVLGISISNVKVRLHRARRMLKAMLGDNTDEVR